MTRVCSALDAKRMNGEQTKPLEYATNANVNSGDRRSTTNKMKKYSRQDRLPRYGRKREI